MIHPSALILPIPPPFPPFSSYFHAWGPPTSIPRFPIFHLHITTFILLLTTRWFIINQWTNKSKAQSKAWNPSTERADASCKSARSQTSHVPLCWLRVQEDCNIMCHWFRHYGRNWIHREIAVHSHQQYHPQLIPIDYHSLCIMAGSWRSGEGRRGVGTGRSCTLK